VITPPATEIVVEDDSTGFVGLPDGD